MDAKTRKLLESYQAGELGDHRTLELFQALVKSGHAWKLGGQIRAKALLLLEQGLIDPK